MAENAIIVELVPEDPDMSTEKVLEEVKSKLDKEYVIKDVKEEPYVFGLKKIMVMIIVPEREGVVYEVEEKLSKIEGVSAEVVSITRI